MGLSFLWLKTFLQIHQVLLVFNYKWNNWFKCDIILLIICWAGFPGILALVSGSNSFCWIVFFRHGQLHPMSACVCPNRCLISAAASEMFLIKCFAQAAVNSSPITMRNQELPVVEVAFPKTLRSDFHPVPCRDSCGLLCNCEEEDLAYWFTHTCKHIHTILCECEMLLCGVC